MVNGVDVPIAFVFASGSWSDVCVCVCVCVSAYVERRMHKFDVLLTVHRC